MTTEPDLLPSSIAAFTEALHGDRGSLDAWLEANDEHEVAAHVEAYARANVAHATAAKDAEIEKLQAIAGCAYQMAGVHDAPKIWLDRLSEAANGDPLPDPDTISDELLPYQPEAVCDAEIRARKLEAEIEALRAEVERLRALAGCAYQMAGMHDAPLVWLDRLSEAANGDALPDADTLMDELLPYQPNVVCEAEARAEQLAEAIRAYKSECDNPAKDYVMRAKRRDEMFAALNHTAAQENDDA